MTVKIIILLIPSILIILSCETDRKSEEQTLTDSSWKLMKIETGKQSEKVIDSPKNYTIRFYVDGKLKVKSDCNNCSGNYTVAGKFIKFINLDCSKQFCGKNSFDYIYKKFLNESTSFSLRSDSLVLESYSGKLLLTGQ